LTTEAVTRTAAEAAATATATATTAAAATTTTTTAAAAAATEPTSAAATTATTTKNSKSKAKAKTTKTKTAKAKAKTKGEYAPLDVMVEDRGRKALNMLQGVGERARISDEQCVERNLCRAVPLLARLLVAQQLRADLMRVGGKAAFVPASQRIAEKLIDVKKTDDDNDEAVDAAASGTEEDDLKAIDVDLAQDSKKKDKKEEAAVARRARQIAAMAAAEKSVLEVLRTRVLTLAGGATLPLKVKGVDTTVLQRLLYGLCVDIAAARRDIDAAGGSRKKKKTRGRRRHADDEDDEDWAVGATAVPRTAEYKVAPSPNATYKSQYFDVESLKVILELPATTPARKVWEQTFKDFDGLTRRLCRSSRDRQRLVSISVHGTSTTLIMESSKRMAWARAASDGTLPPKLQRLIAEYQEVQGTDCGRRDWLLRCLHEHVRLLYKAGSYGQDMVEALARRGDAQRLLAGPDDNSEEDDHIIDSVYLLKNVRCGSAKSYTPTVSDEYLGLGKEVFERVLKEPLAPSDWRGGCVLPERAVALGLMSLRTGASLRRFLESVLVSGDTGIETLCMAVIGQMRPIDSNDDVIKAILNGTRDDDIFTAEQVEALLDKCELVFVIKRIHQVHRKRMDADRQTAEAQKAAEELSASATATGGMRALDYEAMCKHMQVYVKTRPAIYRDSLRRALGGARHYANIGRQHRARAEVQQLADAVALFRAYLATLEQDGARKDELMKRALMPATKHDDRVVFFVGQPRAGQQTHAGHRSGDSMQFVAAARQMVTIGLNEYYTSQKCKACGSELVRTRGWSVRFWRCPHSKLNGTGVSIHGVDEAGDFKREGGRPDGKWRHVAEENKDVIAAMAMMRIGVCVLIDGGRPVEWCSHDVRDAYEKRIAEEQQEIEDNAEQQAKRARTAVAEERDPDGDHNDKVGNDKTDDMQTDDNNDNDNAGTADTRIDDDDVVEQDPDGDYNDKVTNNSGNDNQQSRRTRTASAARARTRTAGIGRRRGGRRVRSRTADRRNVAACAAQASSLCRARAPTPHTRHSCRINVKGKHANTRTRRAAQSQSVLFTNSTLAN
jgi:hypothetical protein